MNNFRSPVKTALLLCFLGFLACTTPQPPGGETSTVTDTFTWENANIYFLLIDRFNNGDSSNDLTLGRKDNAAVARGFMGGDLKGVTEKIKEGYFNHLGVNAIWITPPVEQIHGSTDEGTGLSYGYHGYWTRDWTALDPNFGSMEELKELVRTAHENGIRVIMDVVLNHTGPVTGNDSKWPDQWVRTSPQCTYLDAASTISCTLVENLPDIRTEKEDAVELPEFLVDKWKREERYDTEVQELEAFFARTGYPRAPKYYIIKWLTDFVRETGIDGFRVDTAKHVEDEVWAILFKEAVSAFNQWKNEHPGNSPGDNEFYMVGEVYNYELRHRREFPIGPGEYVDFYDDGFRALINFSFKNDARRDLDSVYAAYSDALNSGELRGKSIVNYISSHDDGAPFDRERENPIEAGTRLLLAPGGVQIYYGDELARPLYIRGAQGDANLRSFMNWEALEGSGKDIYEHWGKLGRFRRDHPSVGAGIHQTIRTEPFVFSRRLENNGISDRVVVALKAQGKIPVDEVFSNGTVLTDAYSGQEYTVRENAVMLDDPAPVVLLAEKR